MKLRNILEAVDVEPARIQKGLRAQNLVVDFFKQEYGEDFELKSVAGRNMKSPDIVANVFGRPTNFEVKLRDRVTDPVTLYDVMLPRGGRDPLLDAFAKTESNGEAKNFTDFIDLQRQTDPSRGWPGDGPEVPKTGGIFISTTNQKTIGLVRRNLLRRLKANHDDYFVIATTQSGAVDVYDVGTTNDELKAPRLPNIRRIIVKTYGSGHMNKTTGKYNARITVKAVFAK